MPTKPKTDPESLRKRLMAVLAKEIRAAEKWKKDHPDELLDYKIGAQLTAYLKQITEVLNEEERWARKMLAEAAKLTVDELKKRAAGVEEADDATEESPDEDD